MPSFSPVAWNRSFINTLSLASTFFFFPSSSYILPYILLSSVLHNTHPLSLSSHTHKSSRVIDPFCLALFLAPQQYTTVIIITNFATLAKTSKSSVTVYKLNTYTTPVSVCFTSLPIYFLKLYYHLIRYLLRTSSPKPLCPHQLFHSSILSSSHSHIRNITNNQLYLSRSLLVSLS